MTNQKKTQGRKRKILKRVGVGIGIFFIILCFAILGSFINHKIKLNQESDLFKPLGKMVTVDGHSMSVYTEGKGHSTLVFLAGGGTASPILDFKSLYSRLDDDFKIAVVERLGYGFSDVADEPRDLDTVLKETRKALNAAGVKGPYILFPHSMAGLTAIYWAQKYPDEVSAIVGLDPAVPESYTDVNIPNRIVFDLFSFGAKMGITRFIPSFANGQPAIKAGSLTHHEKEVYKAILYRRTETQPMIEEILSVKANAQKVETLPPPQVPMLFFTSNGNGTGINTKKWRQYQTNYLAKVNDSQQVIFNYGHYVQNYKYKTIATKSRQFIHNLGDGHNP